MLHHKQANDLLSDTIIYCTEEHHQQHRTNSSVVVSFFRETRANFDNESDHALKSRFNAYLVFCH